MEDILKRVKAIEHAAHESTTILADDALFLCGVIRKLYQRADEYDFPSFLGCINKLKEQAYAVRFDRILDLHTDVDIHGIKDEWLKVFSMDITCDRFGAVCIRSPWIRLDPSTSEREFFQLRKCKLRLEVDGTPILNDEPIGPYLIGPDGTMASTPTFMDPITTAYVYQAAELEDDQAMPEKGVGIFAPYDTKLDLRIYGPSKELNRIKGVGGLCAAYYTTRPVSGASYDATVIT